MTKHEYLCIYKEINVVSVWGYRNKTLESISLRFTHLVTFYTSRYTHLVTFYTVFWDIPRQKTKNTE